MSLSGPEASQIGAFVIDPLDPYLYFEGEFDGVPFITAGGIGFSAQGNIGFSPLVEIYDIPEFDGNIFLKASLAINPYPFSFDGDGVIGFNPGEKYGIISFLKGEFTDLTMGINGSVSFSHESLDFFGISIELGKATGYLDIKAAGNTTFKFVGDLSQPTLMFADVIKQFIGEKAGSYCEFIDYLQFQRMERIVYGTIAIPNDLKDWDNAVTEWELGFKNKCILNLLGFEMIMGETLLEINSDHLMGYFRWLPQGFTLNGPEELDPRDLTQKNFLFGEFTFEGDFLFSGQFFNGLLLQLGPVKLDFGTNLAALMEKTGDYFRIIGDIKMGGEACVGDICAGFSYGATVEIDTDGNFSITFSIGIGPFGYKLTINFSDNTVKGKATEIPLEQVPLENRFEEGAPVPTEFLQFAN